MYNKHRSCARSSCGQAMQRHAMYGANTVFLLLRNLKAMLSPLSLYDCFSVGLREHSPSPISQLSRPLLIGTQGSGHSIMAPVTRPEQVKSLFLLILTINISTFCVLSMPCLERVVRRFGCVPQLLVHALYRSSTVSPLSGASRSLR